MTSISSAAPYANVGAPTALACYTQFSSTSSATYQKFVSGPANTAVGPFGLIGVPYAEPIVTNASAYYARWASSGVTQWRVSCLNYGNGSAPWVVTYSVASLVGASPADQIVYFPIPYGPALMPFYVLSTEYFGGLYVRVALVLAGVACGAACGWTATARAAGVRAAGSVRTTMTPQHTWHDRCFTPLAALALTRSSASTS